MSLKQPPEDLAESGQDTGRLGGIAPDEAQASGSNVPPAKPLTAPLGDNALLAEFGRHLAARIAPHLDDAAVQQAVLETQQDMQQPTQKAAQEGFAFKLVYAHNCSNMACTKTECTLCKHNPRKRCVHNFAPKYWVGDEVTAKCGAHIELELIDCATNARCATPPTNRVGLSIQMVLLDGKKYARLCREAGEQRVEFLDQCTLPTNHQGTPLLQSMASDSDLQRPSAPSFEPPGDSSLALTSMVITESSESVLQGTKQPPFRMLATAVDAHGRRVAAVKPAVSEEFVVVTKRTKTLEKQEIPALDDPINRLNHIGKETVKKLHELQAAAAEAQLPLPLPEDLTRIVKVRDFLRLTQLAAEDGHLQQKLKQVLKLSKDKWEAAARHAASAVQSDHRLRAWYVDDMQAGVLFASTNGAVDLQRAAALLMVQARPDEGDVIEVMPTEQLMPSQHTQLVELSERAREAWFQEGHPGWMIFTLGGQHYDSLEQIQTGHEPTKDAAPLLQDSTAAAAVLAAQSQALVMQGMQEGLLTALLLQHVAAPAQLEGGQAVWSGASVGNGAHAAPHQELAPSLQPQGEDEQAAAALADLRSLTGQRARGSPSAGVVKPKRARHG